VRRPAFDALADLVLASRGSANELRRLSGQVPFPVVWVDHDRRCVHANEAARLFLRRTRDEMRRLTLHDLVASRMRATLDGAWSSLHRNGVVSGTTEMRAPDGAALAVDCLGVANALPGRHLFAWIPSHWPADELGDPAVQRAPAAPAGLSRREREVLELLADGASLDDIAGELSISATTAKTHVRNAARRLGARHRAHAVALAFRAGELSLDGR
jgi:DNA-binding CsgD family transcriptional regulator